MQLHLSELLFLPLQVVLHHHLVHGLVRITFPRVRLNVLPVDIINIVLDVHIDPLHQNQFLAHDLHEAYFVQES